MKGVSSEVPKEHSKSLLHFGSLGHAPLQVPWKEKIYGKCRRTAWICKLCNADTIGNLVALSRQCPGHVKHDGKSFWKSMAEAGLVEDLLGHIGSTEVTARVREVLGRPVPVPDNGHDAVSVQLSIPRRGKPLSMVKWCRACNAANCSSKPYYGDLCKRRFTALNKPFWAAAVRDGKHAMLLGQLQMEKKDVATIKKLVDELLKE